MNEQQNVAKNIKIVIIGFLVNNLINHDEFMYFYFLSSVLRYPLRFLPKKKKFGSSLTPVVCRRATCLFTLLVFAWAKRCSTYNAFLFCLSSSCLLCTLYCQFILIVHFWLPLRYSLTVVEKTRVLEQWRLPNRKVHRRHCHVTGCMTSSYWLPTERGMPGSGFHILGPFWRGGARSSIAKKN
jgi:hypothetical protein